jgi:hypothetical protein
LSWKRAPCSCYGATKCFGRATDTNSMS